MVSTNRRALTPILPTQEQVMQRPLPTHPTLFRQLVRPRMSVSLFVGLSSSPYDRRRSPRIIYLPNNKTTSNVEEKTCQEIIILVWHAVVVAFRSQLMLARLFYCFQAACGPSFMWCICCICTLDILILYNNQPGDNNTTMNIQQSTMAHQII